MAKRRNNLYYLFEYIAFRIVQTIVRILPLETAIALARFLSLVWWWMDTGHQQIADENLRLAFGDKMSEGRRRQVIKDMYRHFGAVGVEMIKFTQVIRRDNWRQHVDFQHSERLFDAVARGRGTVVVTGHYGNFELLSYFLNLVGSSMLAIGRKFDNPYMDDYLWSSRARAGQRMIVSGKGVLKRAALALRHGDMIGIVPDQNAGRQGVFVELFGKKASTYPSFAGLAVLMKAPIVPGYARRVGHPMKYVIYCDFPIEPVDTGDRQRDIETVIREFHRRLEKYITDAPEQWLWSHRRWKTRPPEELAANKAAKTEAAPLEAAGG